MHISGEEALRLARKIENQFNSNHMILFVGQSASTELLSDYILRLPWSCVFTTSRDPGFSSQFINDNRTVKEYSFVNVTSTPLDRNCVPVLRLYGVEGQTNDNGEDDFLTQLGLGSTDSYELNKKYVELWPKLLEYVNQMFVIGYNSSAKDDIPIAEFAKGLYAVPNENVTFFDVSENDDILIRVSNAKHFPFYYDSFSEILSIAPDHTYDVSDAPLDSSVSNVYYINGKATSIDDMDLVQTKHFATLLTDKEVYSIRPQGRCQQAAYFLNFLNQSSSEGPQWYGYLNNTRFYLEREYYTTLKKLVEVFATSNIKSEYPILLQGNPSSSKSVSLGALAFELFNQHNYPIIFIHDEFLSLTAGSIEFDALNTLMSKIQNASASPIVLFWDCSSHRNVLNHAKQLVKDLKNVGRNAIVICTSYVYSSIKEQFFTLINKEKGIYLHEVNKIDGINSSQLVRKADGCYIVTADRIMTDEENRKLRSLFSSYSGIPSAHLNKWWKQLDAEAHNDIFDYFYTLISLIRPELQEGLSAEQDIVSKYVRKQLDRIKADYINEINEKRSFTNSNIFELAGFDLSELGLSSDEINMLTDDSSDEELYDLDKFFTCIALFSQFKLFVPSGFALKVLLKQYSNDFSVFTESGKKLFRIITNDIPWIRYGQHGTNEDFTFSFRNTREAEIFLDKNEISADRQIDIVCDLLDYLGMDYRDNGYVDYNIKTSIQQLLRLLGPNTSYIEFKKNGIRQENHKVFIKKLNLIIEKLENLRTLYNFPDEDGTFTNIEVTFVREYYGKREIIYNGQQRPWIESPSEYSLEDFHTRLDKLSSAISLARSVIAKIENSIHELSKFDQQYIWDTRNALINEMVLCNLSAESIVKEYKDWCWDYQIIPLDQWKDSNFVLPYSAVFSQMKSVIDSNPANGYYYNTLFKTFEREYARPVSVLTESRKMQYLMQITQISDAIDGNTTIIITNRGANGRDELSEHILTINKYASKYSIGIDQILSRGDSDNVFLQQYDQLMEVNNPTGILFVCRTEMEKGGLLKVNQRLSDAQISTCKKIIDFMKLDSNYNCIEGNSDALAFLIRVVWMHHTGLPFYSHEEGLTIGLTTMQWKEIDNLCSDYYRLTLEHASPRIVLINALARLQTTGSFEECDKIIQCIHERNFYSSNRMNTPFIYCDEEGKPHNYTGKVLSTKNTSGFIEVNKVPKYLGGNVGIRFKMYNLGITNVNHMPRKDNVLKELEIGIGYPGFALYRESGRKLRKEA